MVEALKPEYVTPLALYMVHDSFKESGQVFEAGAQWYGTSEFTIFSYQKIHARQENTRKVTQQRIHWELACKTVELITPARNYGKNTTYYFSEVLSQPGKGGAECDCRKQWAFRIFNLFIDVNNNNNIIQVRDNWTSITSMDKARHISNSKGALFFLHSKCTRDSFELG